MYAVVRIGGRQYPVEEGKTLVVEKLPHEVGDSIELNEVLFLGGAGDGEGISVGQPLVEGASVSTEVIEQFKGRKVVVFKYKSRVGYRRKQGHRQQYTRLRINEITAG
jgi:large subunit ribosomal protein L21